MFRYTPSSRQAPLVGAIHRAMAVIEFDPKGMVLRANSAFFEVTGYSAETLAGRHHSVLCTPEHVADEAYAGFWSRLRQGEFISGRCKRLHQDGTSLWLEATYSPVRDRRGRVVRVIKIATDTSALSNELLPGQAISLTAPADGADLRLPIYGRLQLSPDDSPGTYTDQLIPFPAGAGMNHRYGTARHSGRPVPRRRGDEPITIYLVASGLLRSPQARG